MHHVLDPNDRQKSTRPRDAVRAARPANGAPSPAPPLVVAESFALGPGTRLHGHHHPRVHLCCVAEGGFAERTPEGWVACVPGTIRVSPASASHHLEIDAGAASGSIVELPDAVTAGLVRPLARAVFFRPGADGGGIRAARLLAARDPFEIEAGALEMAAAAVLSRARRAAPVPGWLVALRAEVDGTPALGRSLGRVAGRFARHRAHVGRSFREHFGRSLGAHVRLRLLFEAARRLRTTDQKVADLAHELGFTDQAHFTRAFRMRFGLPPGRFRSAARV